MERIESAANAKIKWAAALRMRKERDRRGEFVAEGVRLVEEAAAANWPLLFCLATEEGLNDPRAQSVAASLEARDCPVFLTTTAAYKKASATETPQGIMLVMKKATAALPSLKTEGTPLLAIMDRIQDPGNAGTILRTADAAGCSAVIAVEGTVDLFSEKTVRSAMGSLFHLPIVAQASYSELTAYINNQGISCFASALDKTAAPYYAADYRKPAAVVFGNEGNGVSQEILDSMPHIYIPMAGRTESLNVAASAAIILYEAFRQRHMPDSFQQR